MWSDIVSGRARIIFEALSEACVSTMKFLEISLHPGAPTDQFLPRKTDGRPILIRNISGKFRGSVNEMQRKFSLTLTNFP
jgi:hypothetical protein